MFDLMTTVEYGGCSAKLSPAQLDEVLKSLQIPKHKNLIIGSDTHDDAAVYKINEEQAIIFTTDFFPPVCSDPYDFGQIAACNALSDVYAMGGEALMALNLIMFPSTKIPIEVLKQILSGGQDKVLEAGAITVGGHTIDDFPPKYGLAVVGMIHPKQIVSNAGAKPGDMLILTKPIGTGVILAGKRLNMVSVEAYNNTIYNMKLLNKNASILMRKYEVKCATDITGFGLLGHAIKLARESNVCINIDSEKVPFLNEAIRLSELGCLPGAAFRNQKYVESYPANFSCKSYEKKMLLFDAQTSGGLLICINKGNVDNFVKELKASNYPEVSIIGEVTNKNKNILNIF